MPVITYDELKQIKSKNLLRSPGRTKYLGYYLDDAREILGDPLADKLREYKKAFEDVDSPEILQPGESKTVNDALGSLFWFRDFLNETDKDGVTNYQKICEALEKNANGDFAVRDFANLLKERDEFFQLGLDIPLLNQKMAENKAQRKAKEKEKQEEPEGIIHENEGHGGAKEIKEDADPVIAGEKKEDPPVIREEEAGGAGQNIIGEDAEENEPLDLPLREPQGPRYHTAAQHIEQIRDGGFPITGHMEQLNFVEQDNYFENFCKILAAREIADSDPGERAKLDASIISDEKLARRAAQLKDDPTLQAFMQELKDHPEKMQAAVDAARKRPGHGGGLEKMFRKYLLTLPAGKLPHNPDLKRFLPTYKERIEELQDQAAKKVAKHGNPVKELSEIITLRNMAKAVRKERGAKSLDKPIETSTQDVLKRETERLSGDLTVQEAARNPRVREEIKTGHGGLMTEKMRACAIQMGIDPEIKKSLFGNTASRQLERMRPRADDLKAELDAAIRQSLDPQSPQMQQLRTRSLKMIGEYMILDDVTRDPKTHNVSEAYSIKDVPWQKVNQMREQGTAGFPGFENIVKDFTLQDLSGMLDAMANDTQNHAMTYMVETRNAKQAARQENAGRQGQQAGPQPDGPQAGV